MKMAVWQFPFLLLSLFASTTLAEKVSGPVAGEQAPALTVYSVVPDTTGGAFDIIAKRGMLPTIYFFVPAERWSRPAARQLKMLDTKINGVHSEGKVVAVWLTDSIDDSQAYLPRAQSSLKLKDTIWTVYDGKQTGPKDWSLNTEIDATVVIVNNGKIVASQSYMSSDEPLSENVLVTLKNSLDGE